MRHLALLAPLLILAPACSDEAPVDEPPRSVLDDDGVDPARPGRAPDEWAAEVPRVHADVRALFDAVYSNDVDEVMERTHPNLIGFLGGPDEARAALVRGMSQLDMLGFELTSLEFPSPPVFASGFKTEFVVVPLESVVKTGTKSIYRDEYRFGARAEGETTWRWADSSRVGEKNVSNIFPNYRGGLEFPATTQELR